MDIQTAQYTDDMNGVVVTTGKETITIPITSRLMKYINAWVARGNTIAPAIQAPEPSEAEQAEFQMTSDRFTKAWVSREARKEGKTTRQIMDEIKSEI